MSSQLKVTSLNNAAVARLNLEMSKRLQAAAGRDVREKLASGEIKIVDGRYVASSDSSLRVKRSSVFSGVNSKKKASRSA
ncbi:hypothetical protein [Pantoea ananatis]|uniref:hypothetical protein n=1 Tax=Pantoea ananas TaxID=553 RepID=UPI001B317CE9|nr:hypothetical protein [Pantoea ananatis]